MDLPDLVRQAVGDEEIRAGVTLGDEDAVVFTPTRALVYRGEGLLSDEDVATYGFDFERLAVSEGRRKTKYTMSYVEGERSFTVPSKRTDDVLENLLEGMLRVAEAIEPSESVTGVFRFSEMTLVVAEKRLLKHIGEYTWDADFEAFPYDDLTKLAFEEGSVATQVVLSVGTRSERIKAPNAEAGLVRKTLQQAVFSHYDVGSLEELNREVAVEEDEEPTDATGGLGLDSGIDPLVSDDADEAEGFDPATESTAPGADADGEESAAGASRASGSKSQRSRSADSASQESAAGQSRSQDQSKRAAGQDAAPDARASDDSTADSRSASTSSAERESTDQGADAASVPAAAADDEIREQLADLTRAVERQNELLHRQQQTVEKLIEELRQGR